MVLRNKNNGGPLLWDENSETKLSFVLSSAELKVQITDRFGAKVGDADNFVNLTRFGIV